jgi:circadian clock protein KaiC
MASERERIGSGVPGLDRLIQGGLPRNSVTLVSGAPGTGKSILCLQYICHGALHNEPGVYVTFEQSEKDLLSNARKVGLNLEPLIKRGKLKVMPISLGTLEQAMVDVDALMEAMGEEIKKVKAKRIVIDSLSSLINVFTLGQLGKKMESDVVEIGKTKLIPLVVSEKPITRTIIWNALGGLKGLGCTSLVTSETPRESRWFSRDTISEFVVDGIIALHSIPGEESFRTMTVPKMRGTKQGSDIYSVSITDKGIVIKA